MDNLVVPEIRMIENVTMSMETTNITSETSSTAYKALEFLLLLLVLLWSRSCSKTAKTSLKINVL